MMPEEQTPDQNQPIIGPPEPSLEVPLEPEQPAPDKNEPNDSRLARFKNWYGQRKKWAIPLTVLIVILILAGVPWTRYNLAGLAVKRDLSVEVMDATANTPVSGASVSLGTQTAETDAGGKAVLHKIKPGRRVLTVSKKYYQNRQFALTAPIFSQKSPANIAITATGRQVKVTVSNLINGNKLSNVDIKTAGTTAKTDSSGAAVIVVPAGASSQTVTLSLNGFNTATETLQVSSDNIADNNFKLTPAGKVYFLSKLSGTIDVVKTNLDGSGRQTVLAGTGNEDPHNTVLLASPDWKYAALLSRRAGTSPTLYMIDTSNDNLSTIDQGDADFSVYSWVGDKLIYSVTNHNLQSWQSGQQVLKSYDASAKKLITLDQTTASGSGSSDYVAEQLGDVYVYNGQIFYLMGWTAGLTASSQLAQKQATLNSVQPDGSGKKAIKSFAIAAGAVPIDVSLNDQITSPGTIELHFFDGMTDTFYTYADGQVKTDPTMTNDKMYTNSYPDYLLSPGGDLTFWSEPRDGKNTLFTGDQNGQNPNQIATLSDFSPYGWYSDKYLLVSKAGSELYIMPVGGSAAPVKISDFDNNAASGYGDTRGFPYL